MPKQDIVVGASAGGVEALKVLAAGLPADLKASVFVVLQIGVGMSGPSYLPGILSKAGPLPAVRAKRGRKNRDWKVYVAPPECHVLLKAEHIQLSHGPKENRTRPAISPLFRSATLAYGGRGMRDYLKAVGLRHIDRLPHGAVDHIADLGAIFQGLSLTQIDAIERHGRVIPEPSRRAAGELVRQALAAPS